MSKLAIARAFVLALIVVGLTAGPTLPARAQDADVSKQLEALRRHVEELERRDREKGRRIEELEEQLERLDAGQKATGAPARAVSPTRPGPPTEAPQSPQDALDAAIADIEKSAAPAAAATPSDLWSRQIGAARLRLIDISLDVLAAAGGSTVDDDVLQDLQGGAHDPRKNGFTLQQAELGFAGAVDPYFRAETYIVYSLDPIEGESVVEIEEAFATTQSLPWGLELEAGHFFTEFGRINPRHPHQWEWQDQPVVNTRLFGGDGMRAPGARIGWLTPLPWFSELHYGIQNANGETMVSFLANDEVFEERAIGGRPFTDRDVDGIGDLVHLARWDNSWDLTPQTAVKVGLSGLYGPNPTGEDAETWIYGADFVAKWRGARSLRGWPFLLLQAEIMRRDYEAAGFTFEAEPDDPADDVAVAGDTLHDWGLYTQALYGFDLGWAAGLRFDWADGDGAGFDPETAELVGRGDDPFRDRRWRLSPLLAWYPTEFSRLRLQYNYDDADHLDDGHAHSMWLGLEVLFGAHPAHKF